MEEDDKGSENVDDSTRHNVTRLLHCVARNLLWTEKDYESEAGDKEWDNLRQSESQKVQHKSVKRD